MKSGQAYVRYFLIIAAVITFIIWSWADHFSVQLQFDWSDVAGVVKFLRSNGVIGPLVIIFGMAVAIVFSPLPSAPIAMAAGATYGHFEGTLYIFIGSLFGASLAFGISRVMGFEAARIWVETRFPSWKLGDHQRLMWLIMLSRLMPFISFDLMSYAAGVTTLSYWRFLLATAIGILPASFLLAHFGEAFTEQTFTVNAIIVVLFIVMAGVWRLKTSTSKSRPPSV
ncbi:TVP38/TMEM64 family protein [Amphritea sp.]|uniref:TVP38/TMEM64 family protein n=1 Tax=Amphritea sp. TaxID=1872502 RepID=UPI0025B8E172|nr:TVP38/TMEM64 family protein [Amphritea sp.]